MKLSASPILVATRAMALVGAMVFVSGDLTAGSGSFCAGETSSSGDSWLVKYYSPNPVTTRDLHERIVEIVPRNETAEVCPSEISILTSMPQHGHGMSTKPKILIEHHCKFRIVGNHWHMPGRWQQKLILKTGYVIEEAYINVDLKITGCR